MATPNYLFPEIAEGQASKHLTHNEALRMIEVALGSNAQSAPTNTPPVTPVEGTLYILGSAPTGVWADKPNNLALRINGFWLFVPPNTNISPIYSKSDSKFYRYDGTSWIEVVLSAAATASNVGAAGVGLFKQATASNLEFKTINSASAKVSVTNDLTNSEIDLDVVEGNLNLANIGGAVVTSQLPNTSVVPGTYNSVTVNQKGNVTSASNVTVGASSPIASMTATGTVKTDVSQSDPVVYTKTTSDTLLAAKEPTITTLSVSKGGTGVGSAPANGQLAIGNGTGYSLSTLTAGSNVVITNSAGNITIASSGGGSGSTTRETITFTSGLLLSQEKLNFDVSLGKRFDVLAISTNVPAWVRIYPNSIYRENDTRLLTDNPPPGYQFTPYVDVVTTSSTLNIFLIPNVACASMEAIPSSNISCTVVNLSNTSNAVAINFTVVKKEI